MRNRKRSFMLPAGEKTKLAAKSEEKKMHEVGLVILFSFVCLTVSVHDGQRIKQTRIPCTANTEKGLQYRKISWYKVEEESNELTGLVIKDLRTSETVLYKFAKHSYEVGEDYSLLIPEFGERDCGNYRCTLWPPVGHQIQDGNFGFYPLGCSKPLQWNTVGEMTRPPINNIPLFLIISVLLVSVSIAIVYLCWKRTKWNRKTKNLQRNSVHSSGEVLLSVKV
ncbi:uncharacterized protein [Hoplias malabaricus]|uniref:uncharacterized protein n=1 Tax=Hoplias malabaricus TaxID=27720 RepID=UPI0034634256